MCCFFVDTAVVLLFCRNLTFDSDSRGVVVVVVVIVVVAVFSWK